MDIIVFGEKEEDKEYIWRPGVYGLLFTEQKDKIAVIQTSDGKYFLPGGGIEDHETHKECLKRESLEEMGMEVEIGQYIGCARSYFYSTNQYKYYLSEGYFYICNKGKKHGEPTEEGHFLKWMGLNEATIRLFHEHQSWAVNEASKRILF